DLRVKAIRTLLRLMSRDRRAWEAIEQATEHDRDGIVRRAAAEALQGAFFVPPKRRQRRQGRHDQKRRAP
ncbi:MAG TPA: hypothetical protein VME46_19910, partial [Acidimicrobiales bacterium]|nr:hypothetical protein [Acidimicrobiales bacterium]